MKRLGQAPNLALATLWADTLREAGVDVSVQRQFLVGVAGELPPDQCLPELWLRHDEQLALAKSVLDDLQHVAQRDWLCGCGERVEGGFEQCWACGALMPLPG